jgi:hypothetical protein
MEASRSTHTHMSVSVEVKSRGILCTTRFLEIKPLTSPLRVPSSITPAMTCFMFSL